MSIDLKRIQLDRLQKDIGFILADGIEEFVVGAKEDVRKFALAIARDLLEVHLMGNDLLKGQLIDQLKVLAEIHRIQTANLVWDVVGTITQVIFKAALAGALSVMA